MDVSIIIATYGANDWLDIANQYAVPSAQKFGVPVIRVHSTDGTLASVRNTGAFLAQTEWICFLDADDHLGENYFAWSELFINDADILVPRLLFHDHISGSMHEPFDLTQRDILTSNPCPIGSVVRKKMFDDVGGFWNEPIWEDWSLFRRMYLAGAHLAFTNSKYISTNVGDRNDAEYPNVYSEIIASHEEWLNGRSL